jgi:hypothetical protein
LLETLFAQALDLHVFILQTLQTPVEWVGDLELVAVAATSAVFGVVEGRFHLADLVDDGVCLVDHFLLLGVDEADLAVECFRQSIEELRSCQQIRNEKT